MIINMKEVVEKYLNNAHYEMKENIETLLDTFLSNRSHFLLLKKYQYIKLKNKSFLGIKSRTTLDYIIQNLSTKVSEIKKINSIIKITDEESEIKKIVVNEQTIFLLPVDKAINFYFESSVLITENLTDAKIYIELAKLYLKEKNNKSTDLSITSLGSGGSQIKVQYENTIINEKKQGLCIVDSDKKYPNCKLGNTAKELKNIIKDDSINEVIILENQRELENFIPYDLLEYLSSTTANSFCKLIDKLMIPKEFMIKYYPYIDVKNGICIKEFSDCNWVSFWYEFLKKLDFKNITCKINEKEIIFSSCEEITLYDKNDIKDISEKLCNGYGDKIANEFFHFLKDDKLKFLIKDLEIKKNLIIKDSEKNKKIKEIIKKIEKDIEDYQIRKKTILKDNDDLKLIVKKVIDWGAHLYIPHQKSSIV